MKITYTKVSSTNPPTLTKIYSDNSILGDDFEREIKKTSSANLLDGFYEVCECENLKEFYNHRKELKSNQAFVLCGVPKDDSLKGKLTTKNNKKENPNSITRTKDDFKPNSNKTIIGFDFDEVDGKYLTPKEAISFLEEVIPETKESEKLTTFSSSSFIYDIKADKYHTELKGLRVYIPVIGVDNLDKLKDHILYNSWIKGYGYIMVSKACSMLVRTHTDLAVLSYERLDFPLAKLEGDLEYRYKNNRDHQWKDGNVLDLNKIDYLDKESINEAKTLISDAIVKERGIPEVKAKQKAESLKKAIKHVGSNASKEKIDKEASHIYNMLISGKSEYTLTKNFEVIVLEDGVEKIVNTSFILSNIDRFHLAKTLDLFEPDYQGRTQKGIIYLKDENNKLLNKPLIHSLAHGGINYFLKEEVKEEVKKEQKQKPWEGVSDEIIWEAISGSPLEDLCKALVNRVEPPLPLSAIFGKALAIAGSIMSKPKIDNVNYAQEINFEDDSSFGSELSRVLIKTGCGKQAPNIYSLMVAPPASGKDAGNIDVIISRKMNCYLPNSFSREGLIDSLKSDCYGLSKISEFDEFLNPKSWKNQSLGVIKSLYSENYYTEALKKSTKEKRELTYACPSFSVCIQPNTWNRYATLALTDDGLIQRFIICILKDNIYRMVGEEEKCAIDFEKALVSAKYYASLEGVVYADYRERYAKMANEFIEAGAVQSYVGRFAQNYGKLATILFAKTGVIDEDIYERCDVIFKWLYNMVHEVLNGIMGTDDNKGLESKIERLIEYFKNNKKGVTKTEISNSNVLRGTMARERSDILDELCVRGIIKKEDSKYFYTPYSKKITPIEIKFTKINNLDFCEFKNNINEVDSNDLFTYVDINNESDDEEIFKEEDIFSGV